MYLIIISHFGGLSRFKTKKTKKKAEFGGLHPPKIQNCSANNKEAIQK